VSGTRAERFADRVAIVTGTGENQGRIAALRLAAEGARIVACELDEAAGDETARLLRDAGARHVALSGVDLTDEANVERLVATAVDTFRRIDLVYNNAAGARMGAGLDVSREDFDFTIAGTLTIPWLVTKHAAPVIGAGGGGAIVSIASISGFVGAGMVGNAPLLSTYGAAKAALLRLTQTMAIELAPLNVRMNAVSPGIIDTTAVAPILGRVGDPRLLEWHLEHLLIKRPGTPEDVIGAALFLLSYITGHNLVVDGGWSASGGVGPTRSAVAEALHLSLAAAAGG
jgi:meso-butanediol dehydrogenase/(S,S)-butanediol dehydrogenase/diacetyl reductase